MFVAFVWSFKDDPDLTDAKVVGPFVDEAEAEEYARWVMLDSPGCDHVTARVMPVQAGESRSKS